MSKHEKPEPNPIKQRVLFCTQSPGRLSRSMTADGLMSWLAFANAPFAAIDTDPQHHTLSDRHAPKVKLHDALASEDEFGALIEALPIDAPTLIIDFPSQATAKILDYCAHFGVKDTWRDEGVKPTILIFPADDSTAKDSAVDSIDFFGDDADYLLIENSARFKSDSFKATALYDWFLERRTPTITIPRISAGTLSVWEAAQHEAGRGLSLDAICKLEGLRPTPRRELAGVRDRFLVQFEDCADRLVPDVSLIKNKVQRVEAKRAVTRPSNRYGNPMVVRK